MGGGFAVGSVLFLGHQVGVGGATGLFYELIGDVQNFLEKFKLFGES